MKTLYKKAKSGKIEQWSVWTEGGDIVVEHGYTNGKKQVGRKAATPKNVGRSNETTAEQQAALEAASIAKKKIDKGYFETEAEAKNEIKILPMLAHEYSKYAHNVKWPCYVQPKLDGVRCLFYDGKLISRGGQEYNVPHILKELIAFHGKTTKSAIDGEIYIHGKTIQEIVSLVKKNKPESENLQYWTYDRIDLKNPNKNFYDRYLTHGVFYESGGPVIEIESLHCPSEEKMYSCFAKFINAGFEGLILRQDGSYEIGHRSQNLLKVKTFDDQEFVIIGVKEGRGKFAGSAIFTCVCKAGTFDVTAPGAIEEKQEMLTNIKNYKGRILKVKHFGWTDGGLPRFPVALCFREKADMS